MPLAAVQREARQNIIKYGFQDSEAKQFASHLKGWADAIFDGHQPEVSTQYPPALRDKIQTALAEAATWLADLHRSPQMELDALVTVLNGRYLPTGTLPEGIPLPGMVWNGRVSPFGKFADPQEQGLRQPAANNMGLRRAAGYIVFRWRCNSSQTWVAGEGYKA